MAYQRPERPLQAVINSWKAQPAFQQAERMRIVRQQLPHWLGPEVAPHLQRVWFKAGTLHLELSSPHWKHELEYQRGTLCQKINQHFGTSWLKSLQVH